MGTFAHRNVIPCDKTGHVYKIRSVREVRTRGLEWLVFLDRLTASTTSGNQRIADESQCDRSLTGRDRGLKRENKLRLTFGSGRKRTNGPFLQSTDFGTDTIDSSRSPRRKIGSTGPPGNEEQRGEGALARSGFFLLRLISDTCWEISPRHKDDRIPDPQHSVTHALD